MSQQPKKPHFFSSECFPKTLKLDKMSSFCWLSVAISSQADLCSIQASNKLDQDILHHGKSYLASELEVTDWSHLSQ